MLIQSISFLFIIFSLFYQTDCNRSTALIVRTHYPRKGFLERLLALRKQCDEAGVRLYVSIHENSTSDDSNRLVDVFRAHGVGQRRIFTYTTEDIINEYPVVENISFHDFNIRRPLANLFFPAYIGWGLSTEAFCLWFKRVGEKTNLKYFWFIEDDVAYSGNIANLLLSHENFDFIATTPLRSLNESNETLKWPFSNVVTPTMASLIPEAKRFTTDEHLRGFSHRFMKELHRY